MLSTAFVIQVANDVLVKHPYNKEQDLERKRGIEMMQKRTRQEVDKENAVSVLCCFKHVLLTKILEGNQLISRRSRSKS
jgi:hypothetical protein